MKLNGAVTTFVPVTVTATTFLLFFTLTWCFAHCAPIRDKNFDNSVDEVTDLLSFPPSKPPLLRFFRQPLYIVSNGMENEDASDGEIRSIRVVFGNPDPEVDDVTQEFSNLDPIADAQTVAKMLSKNSLNSKC